MRNLGPKEPSPTIPTDWEIMKIFLIRHFVLEYFIMQQ